MFRSLHQIDQPPVASLVHTVRILNQDTFTVQLNDSKERLLSFQRSELKEFSPIDKSPMPSYKDNLTAVERADLVAYLMSLKGIPRP